MKIDAHATSAGAIAASGPSDNIQFERFSERRQGRQRAGEERKSAHAGTHGWRKNLTGSRHAFPEHYCVNPCDKLELTASDFVC